MNDRATSTAQQGDWIVMKFGGTSVSSRKNLETLAQEAEDRLQQGFRVLLVVSALSGDTNRLESISRQTLEAGRRKILDKIRQTHHELMNELDIEPNDRWESAFSSLEALVDQSEPDAAGAATKARLLAHGEWLSSALVHEFLESAGLSPAWQDARDLLPAADDSNPLSVSVDDSPSLRLSEDLATQSELHISQGFIAGGKQGQVCLLGRGGSDTSAACLAARLGAGALEIWTDVPGVFSADPRQVAEARLLQSLSYEEMQELASMGARVLHPRSIQPVRRHGIPVRICDTRNPSVRGTRVSVAAEAPQARLKGVVSRNNIVMITMDTPEMLQQVGFLASAFAAFKKHGFSVDLVSTSESTVSVTLDPGQEDLSESALASLVSDLQALCRVTVRTGCVSISLVGNAIRTILGSLSAALDVFQDRRVHMVTQSANDLNLTLLVDSEHSLSLVRKLHQLLIVSDAANRPDLGPSWSEFERPASVNETSTPWWSEQASKLLGLMQDRDDAYVYSLDSIRGAAQRLVNMQSVDRVLYAMKANDHPLVLQTVAAEGMGFECVSVAELDHLFETLPDLAPESVLFTPNFAGRHEYRNAFDRGVNVTLDNSWLVESWPDCIRGQKLFLRLDLDAGYGHHKKVITSGAGSKFGISLDDLPAVSQRLEALGATVVGLHTHTGSGVSNPDAWQEQLQRFESVLSRFPDVRVLDLGGGLSVPERRGQGGLDIDAMDTALEEYRQKICRHLGREISLWMEPGRYLVAEAGVLLSRVTQLKQKDDQHYLGVGVGMNALVRPALYGAYHDIVNLERLHEPADQHYRVVGPICESGDVLGEGRLLPRSSEGDVMLIANAGAYGRVMASSYNRRTPPVELVV